MYNLNEVMGKHKLKMQPPNVYTKKKAWCVGMEILLTTNDSSIGLRLG